MIVEELSSLSLPLAQFKKLVASDASLHWIWQVSIRNILPYVTFSYYLEHKRDRKENKCSHMNRRQDEEAIQHLVQVNRALHNIYKRDHKTAELGKELWV